MRKSGEKKTKMVIPNKMVEIWNKAIYFNFLTRGLQLHNLLSSEQDKQK